MPLLSIVFFRLCLTGVNIKFGFCSGRETKEIFLRKFLGFQVLDEFPQGKKGNKARETGKSQICGKVCEKKLN